MWGAPVTFDVPKAHIPEGDPLDVFRYLATSGPSENRSYFDTLFQRRKQRVEGFQVSMTFADLRRMIDQVELYKRILATVQLPMTAAVLDAAVDLSGVRGEENVTVFEPLIPRAIRNENGQTNMVGLGTIDNIGFAAGIFRDNQTNTINGNPPPTGQVGRSLGDADVIVGSFGTNPSGSGDWVRPSAFNSVDRNRTSMMELQPLVLPNLRGIRLRFKGTVTLNKIFLLRGNASNTFSLSFGIRNFTDGIQEKQSWTEPRGTNGIFVDVSGGATGKVFQIALVPTDENQRVQLHELQFYQQKSVSQADAVTLLAPLYQAALRDLSGQAFTAAQLVALRSAVTARIQEAETFLQAKAREVGATYSIPATQEAKIAADRASVPTANAQTLVDIYGSYRTLLDSPPAAEVRLSNVQPCLTKGVQTASFVDTWM